MINSLNIFTLDRFLFIMVSISNIKIKLNKLINFLKIRFREVTMNMKSSLLCKLFIYSCLDVKNLKLNLENLLMYGCFEFVLIK